MRHTPIFLYLCYSAVHVGNSYSLLEAPEEDLRKHSHIMNLKRRSYAALNSSTRRRPFNAKCAAARTIRAMGRAMPTQRPDELFVVWDDLGWPCPSAAISVGPGDDNAGDNAKRRPSGLSPLLLLGETGEDLQSLGSQPSALTGIMGLRAAQAAFAACCVALVASAPTDSVYYIPVFDTETIVYPVLQEVDDNSILLQITNEYEIMLHQDAVLPPRLLIRTFKDGQPVDTIVNLRYATAAGMDIKMKAYCYHHQHSELYHRKSSPALHYVLRYNFFSHQPDQETYVKYAGNYVNADQTIAALTLRLASGYIPGNFDMAYMLTGMGCVHDGDPPPDYLADSPGATDCPWDDGFIMSYKDGGPQQVHVLTMLHQPNWASAQGIDIMLGPVTPTTGRAEAADFSAPYDVNYVGLMAWKPVKFVDPFNFVLSFDLNDPVGETFEKLSSRHQKVGRRVRWTVPVLRTLMDEVLQKKRVIVGPDVMLKSHIADHFVKTGNLQTPRGQRNGRAHKHRDARSGRPLPNEFKRNLDRLSRMLFPEERIWGIKSNGTFSGFLGMVQRGNPVGDTFSKLSSRHQEVVGIYQAGPVLDTVMDDVLKQKRVMIGTDVMLKSHIADHFVKTGTCRHHVTKGVGGTMHIVMLLRKTLPKDFKRKLDRFITHVNECNFYHKEMEWRLRNYTMCQNEKDDGIKPLAMVDLQGGFVMLVVGVSASLLALVVEWVSATRMVRRRTKPRLTLRRMPHYRGNIGKTH
ncbi:hypothetical protein MTO96_019362 [Rhipicephalus appendiculatus]